jgi:hypothetical protein
MATGDPRTQARMATALECVAPDIPETAATLQVAMAPFVGQSFDDVTRGKMLNALSGLDELTMRGTAIPI